MDNSFATPICIAILDTGVINESHKEPKEQIDEYNRAVFGVYKVVSIVLSHFTYKFSNNLKLFTFFIEILVDQMSTKLGIFIMSHFARQAI